MDQIGPSLKVARASELTRWHSDSTAKPTASWLGGWVAGWGLGWWLSGWREVNRWAVALPHFWPIPPCTPRMFSRRRCIANPCVLLHMRVETGETDSERRGGLSAGSLEVSRAGAGRDGG